MLMKSVAIIFFIHPISDDTGQELGVCRVSLIEARISAF